MALGYKTGGRQKGTPNKDNPLKGYIRAQSLAYFEPHTQPDPDTGEEIYASDFEVDLALLDPGDRISAHLRLLKFHMPEMKAVDMDMTLTDATRTIEDRLAELAQDDAE